MKRILYLFVLLAILLQGCGMIFRSEPNVEQGKQYRFLDLHLSSLPGKSICLRTGCSRVHRPV